MQISIKDKLEEKRLNKNQFAKAMQIGYPAACALYEGTTTRIDLDTLESICRVLECTPNDVFVSNDDETSIRMAVYRKKIASIT